MSFTSTDDGWEYLISKEWARDVQVATQHYKGVSGDCHMTSYYCPLCDCLVVLFFAVFPKYSITRSFCRTLLTEAYRDFLLPQQQKRSSNSSIDVSECLRVFQIVRDISRKTNSFMMDDIQVNGLAQNDSCMLYDYCKLGIIVFLMKPKPNA